MPVEIIDTVRHIVKVCGPPPPEMELEVQWQEHELGSYPTIVFLWEGAMRNVLELPRKVSGDLRPTSMAVNFLRARQCRSSVRKTTVQIVLPSILRKHRLSHRDARHLRKPALCQQGVVRSSSAYPLSRNCPWPLGPPHFTGPL